MIKNFFKKVHIFFLLISCHKNDENKNCKGLFQVVVKTDTYENQNVSCFFENKRESEDDYYLYIEKKSIDSSLNRYKIILAGVFRNYKIDFQWFEGVLQAYSNKKPDDVVCSSCKKTLGEYSSNLCLVNELYLSENRGFTNKAISAKKSFFEDEKYKVYTIGNEEGDYFQKLSCLECKNNSAKGDNLIDSSISHKYKPLLIPFFIMQTYVNEIVSKINDLTYDEENFQEIVKAINYNISLANFSTDKNLITQLMAMNFSIHLCEINKFYEKKEIKNKSIFQRATTKLTHALGYKEEKLSISEKFFREILMDDNFKNLWLQINLFVDKNDFSQLFKIFKAIIIRIIFDSEEFKKQISQLPNVSFFTKNDFDNLIKLKNQEADKKTNAEIRTIEYFKKNVLEVCNLKNMYKEFSCLKNEDLSFKNLTTIFYDLFNSLHSEELENKNLLKFLINIIEVIAPEILIKDYEIKENEKRSLLFLIKSIQILSNDKNFKKILKNISPYIKYLNGFDQKMNFMFSIMQTYDQAILDYLNKELNINERVIHQENEETFKKKNIFLLMFQNVLKNDSFSHFCLINSWLLLSLNDLIFLDNFFKKNGYKIIENAVKDFLRKYTPIGINRYSQNPYGSGSENSYEYDNTGSNYKITAKYFYNYCQEITKNPSQKERLASSGESRETLRINSERPERKKIFSKNTPPSTSQFNVLEGKINELTKVVEEISNMQKQPCPEKEENERKNNYNEYSNSSSLIVSEGKNGLLFFQKSQQSEQSGGTYNRPHSSRATYNREEKSPIHKLENLDGPIKTFKKKEGTIITRPQSHTKIVSHPYQPELYPEQYKRVYETPPKKTSYTHGHYSGLEQHRKFPITYNPMTYISNTPPPPTIKKNIYSHTNNIHLEREQKFFEVCNSIYDDNVKNISRSYLRLKNEAFYNILLENFLKDVFDINITTDKINNIFSPNIDNKSFLNGLSSIRMYTTFGIKKY